MDMLPKEIIKNRIPPLVNNIIAWISLLNSQSTEDNNDEIYHQLNSGQTWEEYSFSPVLGW